MGVERVADEAGRVRIECVGDRLAELAREKLGDLVLETFAGLVGEREIARIRAGAKHMRVDEFDRVFGFAPARPRRLGERPNQREAYEPKREKTALRQTPPTERR